MPFGNPIRTRSERVAALELPPGLWERIWLILYRRDTLIRIVLVLLASIAMCFVIEAWDPPLKYRTGYTPSHNIVARVPFTNPNPEATKLAQLRARSQVRYVYAQDAAPLEQLRARLRNTIKELTAAAELKDADPQIWNDFQLPPPPNKTQNAENTQNTQKTREEQFLEFRSEFTGTDKIERLEQILAVVLGPYEQRGLIDKLLQEPGEGNQDEIRVHPVGQAEPLQTVKVADVLLGDGAVIRDNLRNHIDNKDIADRLFAWLRPKLVTTLKIDTEETALAIKKAVSDVAPVMDSYLAGATLAEAGKSLEPDQIQLLRLEYTAVLAGRPLYYRITRATAMTVMIFTAFMLCGIFTRYRQGVPISGLTRQIVMLIFAVGTVALARWISMDRWRGEILPLLLFGMTTAIVYRLEFALLLTGVLSLIIVSALGQGLPEMLLLMGVATTAILNLGRIRSRSKLIFVGMFSAAVAFLLSVGLGLVSDQPFDLIMFLHAAIVGLWTLTAGFVMTGLLPFIEHMFGILTDLSLLELGDVSHPLLQEMVRRAPSTYNHSVTVGSIAEAAAEAIGARGLLCRVGAYFHDIGKMLKPGYFIENQGPDEDNRHESLVPAMSTLVIIAHIKDGSDLARQHHLPQPIIDMIVQHHGTTLVEYFFDRAQQQSDPQNGEVDESNFRYPGPKPQTKEAAVLMLADAVESASRTLVDPAPARIESLVREIAERRLDDGQFDESGLTLRELRAVERSLVMSLTSIYHGRIKYPEQKTA
jgi:putative nucleotidyltransferase with HDIG domain